MPVNTTSLSGTSGDKVAISFIPTHRAYQVVLPEEAVTEWLSVKNGVREELPYPE